MPWQVNVDLTQPPFYGVSPSGVQTNSTGVITAVNAQLLRITGNGPFTWHWDPRQNNTPITSSQTALLTICVYNAPVPPPAPTSTYAVTYANGTWTTTEACVVATITTTRHDLTSFPFSYGWSIPIDLTAAKAKITSAGNTLNNVGWAPYPNGPTDGTATPATFSPPLDTYTFTSGYNNALRAAGGGADSRTVTACVSGFSKGKPPKLAQVAETSTPEATTSIPDPSTAISTQPATTSTVPPTSVPPTTVPVTVGPSTTASSTTEPRTTEPGTTEPESTAVPTTMPDATTIAPTSDVDSNG